METTPQRRANSRPAPTLDVRKVHIRRVSEAYEDEEDNNCEKVIRGKIYIVLWSVLSIIILIIGVVTYPPSLLGLICLMVLAFVAPGGILLHCINKLRYALG